MKHASTTRKALSVLLSVLMVFGYVGLLSGLPGLVKSSAATVSVNSYEALRSAINTANSASDTTTIQLSGNISVGEVAALPAITKSVILDLHGYGITFSYTGECGSRDDNGEYQLPSGNQGPTSRTDEYLESALINVAAGGSLQIVNKSGTDSTVMAHTRLQRNSTSALTQTHSGATSSNLIYSAGTLILGDKTNAGYNNFTLYANSSCYCDGNKTLIDYNNYNTSACAFTVTVNGSNAKLFMYGGKINASATSRCFYNAVANARCYALNIINAWTAEIYGGEANIVNTSDGTGVQCVTDTDCDGNDCVFAAVRTGTSNVYIFDLTSDVYAHAGGDTQEANLNASNIYAYSGSPVIYGADLNAHVTKSGTDSAEAKMYNIRGSYRIANNGQLSPSTTYGSDLGYVGVDREDNSMDETHAQHFRTVFMLADNIAENGVYLWGKASFRDFLSAYNTSSDAYFGRAQTYLNDGSTHAASTLLNYERTGYTQIGWQGATSIYGAGSTDVTSDTAAGLNDGNGGCLYLYPVWRANVYYIAFNGNGNTGGTAPMRILKTYDQPITLPAGGSLEKTGRVFTGWQTETNGGDSYAALGVLDVDYSTGAPAQEGAPTVTLYATWGNNAHTITYDLAGGRMPAGQTNPASYNGTEAVGSIVLKSPVRDGYAFAGWMDDRFMTVSIVDLALPFAGADPVDLSFEAMWAENEYVITFDPNVEYGGYEYNENMVTQTVAYSETANLTANGYRANVSGYSFAGWNTAADGSGVGFADLEEVTGERLAALEGLTPIVASGGYTYQYGVKLYAQWDYMAYDIVYDGNGARVPVDAQTRYDVNSAIVLPEVSKFAYTFTGWKVTATETVKWKVGDVYSGTVEAGKIGNVSLQAQFTPVNYTITYTGEYVPENTTQTYNIEGTAALLLPEGEGFEFIGWKVVPQEDVENNWLVVPADLEEGAEIPDTIYPATELVTGKYGDVTLLAKWAKAKFSFTANTGAGATVAGAPDEVEYGESYTFTVTMDENHNDTLPTADDIGIENAQVVSAVAEGSVLTVTIGDVTGNVVVSIPTVGNENAVTIDGSGYKASNVAADTTATYGGSFTLEVTVADGYENLVVTLDGDALTADADSTETVYRFTVDPVNGALAFTVSADKKVYDITLLDANGDPFTTLQVAFEATPAYDGDTPVKTATAEYTYSFEGWDLDPNATVPAGFVAVDGPATYYPIYSKTKNSYTITFMNEDGTGQIGTETVEFGTRPAWTGDVPTKDPENDIAFVFAGWTNEVGGTVLSTMPRVQGEATYYAVFAEANAIWVTFEDYDHTEILRKKIAEGSTPVYDGPELTREETAEYSYAFAGWSPALGPITRDTVYTAQYDATRRSYTIKFLDENGETLSEQTLEYGATPAYTVPSKDADENGHYIANGWSPAITTVKGNAEYTAQYVFRAHSWSDPAPAEGFTCTEGGTLVCTCTVGGETKEEEVGPIDHQFGDWVTVTPATFTATGLERRTCTFCGETEERPIPMREGDPNAGGECPICGKVHSKDLIDWVVGIVHQFLYFFRMITGRFSG